MPSTEEEIILNLDKESSDLEDYDSYLIKKREYRLRKQQSRVLFAGVFLLVYVVMALSVLSFFRDTPSGLFPSFGISSSEEEKIKDLELRMNLIGMRVESLQSTISSTQASSSVSYLDSQFAELSRRQNALEESISLDPEKALTAGLLREKQKNLENNFSDLRNAQVRLDSKLSDFITAVFVTPIAVAFVGFFIWFIQRKITKND